MTDPSGDTVEDMLRDRLVCGVSDEGLQKRLLAEPQLTFKKAMELSQTHESATQNAKDLQGTSRVSGPVHIVSSKVELKDATGVEDSIILTSVNIKSPCVITARRRAILQRSVISVKNLRHTNRHFPRKHITLKRIRKLKTVFTQCSPYHCPDKIQFKSLLMLTIVL